MNNECVLLYER